MDRISDSGSDDWGSTPHGCTKKRTAVIAARFFVAEKSIESRHALLCSRTGLRQSVVATITSFHKTFSNKFECFSLTLHYLFIK